MVIHCSYKKLVRTCDLKPHPLNPNKHSKEQIERLAKILKYQGWRYPIKVSTKSGYITSGHGRLMAALLNKWDEVPVDHQDYEDDAQEYADLVADNSIADWAELDLKAINADITVLGPDFDIDLLGINGFTIDVADKHGDEDADAVPEPPKEAKSKTGDLWLLGNHRVLCADSTKREDVERLMGGEKADMVFTDPPYNIAGMMEMASVQSVRKTYRDLKSAEWDQNFDVVGAFKSILPLTNGWIYFFTQPNYFGEIDKICREQDRKTSWGTWVKRNPMPCLRKEGWTYAQEFFVFVRAMDKSFNFPEKGHAYNWWDINTEQANRVHPTQKPVSVSEHAISHSSQQGQSVLDLFLGSGSTLIACEKTNRRCFGIEIDPHYVDVILTRWAKYTGRDPVREDGAKWSELSGTV